MNFLLKICAVYICIGFSSGFKIFFLSFLFVTFLPFQLLNSLPTLYFIFREKLFKGVIFNSITHRRG
jgi:hypothetical protein